MDQFKQKQTYEPVKKLLLKWKRRWSKDSGQSNEKEKTKKKKKKLTLANLNEHVKYAIQVIRLW
jgi:hypothetical protein